MKLLFVHDHFGSWGEAEANLHAIAAELGRRGHAVGLFHGPSTGRDEALWRVTFPDTFPVADPASLGRALVHFRPSGVLLINSPSVDVTAALVASALPVVRLVQDHHLFSLRGCRCPTGSLQPCSCDSSPLPRPAADPFEEPVAGGGWSLAFSSYLRKKGELELHRGFARLVVASDYMREELRRNGFRPDQIEVHSPAEPDPATAADGEPTRQPHRLVFAGQIVRGKGVDVLLEALALVPERFECCIIGEGHHRPFCEQLSRRLGLEDRVRFLGHLPADEVRACYESSSVAVVSSVWPEPFGLAGLEALRHGLPVVAFDAGGVREWLEDGVNGLLAPWMDRAGFAERVSRLLRDPVLARRLGRRGRTALSAERFDFSRYVEGLENLFFSLAPASAHEVQG